MRNRYWKVGLGCEGKGSFYFARSQSPGGPAISRVSMRTGRKQKHCPLALLPEDSWLVRLRLCPGSRGPDKDIDPGLQPVDIILLRHMDNVFSHKLRGKYRCSLRFGLQARFLALPFPQDPEIFVIEGGGPRMPPTIQTVRMPAASHWGGSF